MDNQELRWEWIGKFYRDNGRKPFVPNYTINYSEKMTQKRYKVFDIKSE